LFRKCFKLNLIDNKTFFLSFFFIAGAIFEQGTDEVQSAFKFAMLNHNLNITGRRFELQAYVDLISTADAFKLSRLSKFNMKLGYESDVNLINETLKRSTAKHVFRVSVVMETSLYHIPLRILF
jgi:hypothetical protein